MPLDANLRQEIVNFLIELDAFHSENGRKAILLTAGLDKLLPNIELQGKTSEVVPLLVESLTQYGIAAEQQQPALICLLQAVKTQVGPNKQALLQGFCDRLTQQQHIIATCPYRGLSAFREEDEPFFFGRDVYTAKLVDAVQHKSFVAVLGASGSGKSSLVYAGLIPHLPRQIPSWEGQGVGTWRIVSFRPGDHPLQTVAKALIPFLYADNLEQISKTKQLTEQLHHDEISLKDVIAKILEKDGKADHFLLFVDQFEEVYALCDDVAERQRFIDELLHLTPDPSPQSGEGIAVIITLRSDFLGQTHSTPELSHLIADHNLIIPAMNADELRLAIAEPAQAAGQPLSDEVVDLLIEQTKEREGALPLLEFALMRVWEGLASGIDPADTLKQIGGVGGALAGVAQNLYDELNADEQQIARRAFLTMIRLGEDTRDTRRKVGINEIVGHKDDPEQVQQVLRHFAQPNARLITLDEDAAEITHEALFDHWSELKNWLDESREDIRFHRQLEEAVKEWDREKRPDGSLWRQPKLDLLRQFYQRNQQDMTALQVAFFQASEGEQRRIRRKRRITTITFTVLMFSSIVGAILAVRFGWVAEKSRQNAEAKTIEALNQTTEMLFVSHKNLNALLTAIKAGQLIQQTQTVGMLRERNVVHLIKSLNTNYEKNSFAGHVATVTCIAFSPDGVSLVSGSKDGLIKLWNVDTGREIWSSDGKHVGAVSDIEFHPDDTRFATAGNDGKVRLWNARDASLLKEFSGHRGGSIHVAFHPDGQILASSGEDNTIRLRNIDTGEELGIFAGHTEPVFQIQFHPDGGQLVSASSDKTVKIWDTAAMKELKTLEGHTDQVTSIAISPDGQRLASGSSDRTIRLYDLRTNQLIQQLTGHTSGVSSLKFSPDSKLLASGSGDYTIRFWNGVTGDYYETIEGHDNNVAAVAFHPDGRLLASGSSDKTIKFWDPTQKTLQRTTIPAQDAITSVAYSPDGRFLAWAGYDHLLELWDQTNDQRYSFSFPDAYPPHVKHEAVQHRAVAFHPDGNLLALGGTANNCIMPGDIPQNCIILWDVRTQKISHKLPDGGWAFSLAFHPNGSMLASGGYQGVLLWDLNNQNNRVLLEDVNSDRTVLSVAFNKEGTRLASGSWLGKITVWDVASKTILWTLQRYSDHVYSVAFSPAGKTLASLSSGEITLWDLDSGRAKLTFKAHTADTRSIAFSPDGKLLASASFDRTVKLWDAETGHELITLRGHTANIWSLAFSPDGKFLASGGDDGTVRIWDVINPKSFDLQELLFEGCQWIQPYLQYNPNVSVADRTLCDDILATSKDH